MEIKNNSNKIWQFVNNEKMAFYNIEADKNITQKLNNYLQHFLPKFKIDNITFYKSKSTSSKYFTINIIQNLADNNDEVDEYDVTFNLALGNHYCQEIYNQFGNNIYQVNKLNNDVWAVDQKKERFSQWSGEFENWTPTIKVGDNSRQYIKMSHFKYVIDKVIKYQINNNNNGVFEDKYFIEDFKTI